VVRIQIILNVEGGALLLLHICAMQPKILSW
jgi:hypothetical protein